MAETTEQVAYWEPRQPGDSIVGEVIRGQIRATKYSDDVLVLTLRVEQDSTGRFPEGSEAEVWCGRTVLRSQVEEADPEIDDRLSIVYLGLTEGRNGATYYDYRVANLSHRQSIRELLGKSPRRVEAQPAGPGPDDDPDVPF